MLMTHRGAMIDSLSRRFRPSRRVLRAVGMTVVAVIVLELVGFAAWRLHDCWRLGRIELTNEGPPLIVQVLDESGEHPVGEPFDLVARSTLALPDGDYRLRVDGVGRLGRTYRLAVNRGETVTHELALDEGRLLGGEQPPRIGHQETPKEEPRPFAPITVAMELTPGKSDLIEFNGQSVVRRDGKWGRPVWDTSRPSGRGGPLRDTPPWIRAIPTDPGQVSLVDPPPDLNGDGVGDLVWLFHNNPSLLVQSGKHGSLLWNYSAALDGPGGPRPDGPDWRPGPGGPGPARPGTRWAHVLGALAVSDIDRDGVPDLIATVSFSEDEQDIERRAAKRARGVQAPRGEILRRRFLVAISGRSGRWLWTHPIDPTFRGQTSPDWPAAPAIGRRSALIAFVDDQKWVGLDPASGRPKAGPIDLGLEPVRPVQQADLDGDGEPEVLVLGSGPAVRQETLRALSSATGRTLWTATVNARFTPTGRKHPPSAWPWLFDLDGDGRTDIAVPDWGPMPPGDGYRGVRLIDGATGRTRWIRPMRPETPAEDGLAQLADAPDLDGDGTRDLVAVSFFEGRQPPPRTPGDSLGQGRLYVDALSGKDGHPLWYWNRELPPDRYTGSWPPRWWGRGPDGWPLLAVPIGGPTPSDMPLNIASSDLLRPVVHVLEGSTGRELNAALGLYRPRVADLDGDGLDDLWGEADGQLRAFRGQAPEAWRAIGRFDPAGDSPQFRPGSDLDGDGIGDALIGQVQTPGDSVLRATGSHTAVARSGRDGHILWKTVLDPPGLFFDRDRGDSYDFATFPLPAGDLDGDGAPDVLVKRDVLPHGKVGISQPASPPLQALSGRTGRHLWSAGPLPLGLAAGGFSRIHWQSRPEARIIGPGGSPDVMVRHCHPFDEAPAAFSRANPFGQDRLARISGRDGRVLWDIPLTGPGDEPSGVSSNYISPFRFGDLNGDGSLDVVVVIPPSIVASQPSVELKGVSLKEGEVLWSHRLDYDLSLDFRVPLAVGDLDGDRRAEVLVGDKAPGGTEPRAMLKALDGRDGKVLWTYQPAPDEDRRIMGWDPPCLADLDGDGRREIAVIVTVPDKLIRVVILDERGRETARWEFPRVHNWVWYLEAADLDGDRRDELIVMSLEGLHVLGPGLKEMWSRPSLEDPWSLRHLPSSSGRPGTVILPPALGLDGSNGRPRWAGDPGVWLVSRLGLLDAGDATRLPLWIGHTAGTTVCRSAMPVTPAGTFAPPQGSPVRPGLARDDPRWMRPLPWTGLTLGTVGPTIGLALVNAVVPFGILWLAARRRPWSVRLLMAMPIAAAVPLSVFLTFEPLIPVEFGSRPVAAWLVFVLGTLAGLPIVYYAGLAAWSLVRRRWKTLAALFRYTIAASAFIGAMLIWVDRRAMPAIEHYSGSSWYLIVLPGAYVVGVVLLLRWPSRGISRWIRRPRTSEVGTT